jgi:molybdopterin-guanine dinucleotide biosynthesis protein
VEGYKRGPLPKVALVGAEPENRLPDYPGIIALVISEAAPQLESLPSELPVFRREQVAELGRFLKKYLGWG